LEGDKIGADIKWSERPMMFGIVSEKAVLIYDLTINNRKAVLKMSHSNIICALAFSHTE
jgi:hypothetical protein